MPAGFAMSSDEIQDFLLGHGAGDLVTQGPDGFQASLIPFVYDAAAGVLRGHLARNNPQWHAPGEALVIVRGTDTYVSPTWYAAKAEHGRVVPTWNYVTAHVHGSLVVHDDVDFVRQVVTELTDKHEGLRDEPWAVSDAPGRFIDGQLRAIVGVEVVISRIEAKAKASQNRSDADIDGVVVGLRQMADEVEARRPARD